MAIAENPKRSTPKDAKAEQFIAGAGQSKEADLPLKPVMLRINPEILARIDRAAKRLGLTRTGFIVSSAVKEVERMEG
jgi:Protein of unknown function (DUF1778)